MDDLKQKCDNFIKQTPITVRQFCKRIGLSPEAYYKWQRCEMKLKEKKIERIKEYLSSKDSQELLAKGNTYLPTTECAERTGYDRDKIVKLCATGTIDAIRSPGNRWYANVFDLEKYLDKEYPGKCRYNAELGKSIFGDMYSEWGEFWRPLLSQNNDFEIFDISHHEYDKRYWISNTGRVYNTETGRIIGCYADEEKYVRVNIRKDNCDVTPYVHQLVAYCFCPNRRFKDDVHHIDGIKSNNHFNNLLWVTKSEHKMCHKLMNTDKKAYRKYVSKIKRENKW